MGECGCGNWDIQKAYRLADGSVMAWHEYRGCAYCHTGPGYSLMFFPDEKSEWLEDAVIENAPKPDESGGNGGIGISWEVLDVYDMRRAAREMEDKNGDFEHFGSLDDWLEEHGLELLQTAMRKRDERHREIEEQRKKR